MSSVREAEIARCAWRTGGPTSENERYVAYDPNSPHDIVDRVLLVDDASDDATVRLAGERGIETFAHARNLGYGAISCPARYFPEASSIDFRRSVVYGLGVLRTSLSCALWRMGLARPKIFSRSPTLCLRRSYYSQVADAAGGSGTG